MTQHATAASASVLASFFNGAADFDAQAADLLAGCSLTVDRWRILELATRQRDLTMSALAAQLSMPASTATRLVDHLVTDGVLHRVIDRADRRRVVLRVTDKGLAQVGQAIRQLEPLETKLRALLAGDQAAPGSGAGTEPLAQHLLGNGLHPTA